MRYFYTILFFLFLSQTTAYTGSIFEVSSSGEPAELDMVLCLNGKGKISCERHTASALDLSIKTTIPKQAYSSVGIKLNVAGYAPTGCLPYSNGYCLFSIPESGAALIPVRGTIPYTIGGRISGLKGVVILQNENGSLFRGRTDGFYQFSQTFNQGDNYAVTVKENPLNQTCSIVNSMGVISQASKNNINVFCASRAYSIGGILKGATGVVQAYLNGIGPLKLTRNGPFQFPEQLAYGTPYTVTAVAADSQLSLENPFFPLLRDSAQTCTVSQGAGTTTGEVNDITISCSSDSYTVGGSVTGLDGELELTLNDTDPITLDSNSNFTFPTPLADGTFYQVKVETKPEVQTCSIVNGTDSGTISGENVTNVDVQCVTDTTTISLPSSSVIPVTSDASQSLSISVKNEGYDNNAVDVSIVLPTTWEGVTQDTTDCASVPPGGSCTIILRSTTPYVASGDIKVMGANTNVVTISLGFSVSSYLVWSTPTVSSVLVLDSKISRDVWDPQAGGSIKVTGVSDASVAGDNSCLGPTDGRCDTKRIFDTFNPSYPSTPYAARNCYTRTEDETGTVPEGTWYLPAACELTNVDFPQYPPWSCTDINEGPIANIDTNLFTLKFLPEAENRQVYSGTNSSDNIYYTYVADFNYPGSASQTTGTVLLIVNNLANKYYYCAREIALN